MKQSENYWRKAILPLNSTIGEAVHSLNEVQIKIVLIINEHEVLEGTISDGDIRRGLLKGQGLNSPVSTVLHRNPLVVSPDLGRNHVMQLMDANKILQIPIVDESRRVVGLHLWDEITVKPNLPNLMVIMAGGTGSRMRPHTESCPKPLLKVAGKPILEHIIERAKRDGFTRFIISVHYLADMIIEYFGRGEFLNVEIDYLREEAPLGTAGALSLLDSIPTKPFLLTNGDVITDIRYGEILDFHQRHGAAATMAVRNHEWQHPFGVVKTKGVDIVGLEEKPISRTHINAGVYVIDPLILSLLSKNKFCDMPTLFERLRSSTRKIVAYPMHEPWLDVGRPDDLISANRQLL